MCERVCERERVCARVCVRESVRECERESVCVIECVRERFIFLLRNNHTHFWLQNVELQQTTADDESIVEE